jgi:hypothetical protein
MTVAKPARNRRTAHEEIRAAEAARVLGVLDPGPLPVRAVQWMNDGIDSRNVRALAEVVASDQTPGDEVLTALLAEIARDEHISFANRQEARALHSDTVIAMLRNPAEFSAHTYRFSNSVTDDIVAWLRRRFRRD